MERIAQTLTFLAVLGSGLMAGLFFVFSVTIMASLNGSTGQTPALTDGNAGDRRSLNHDPSSALPLAVDDGTETECVVRVDVLRRESLSSR